jgi:hypothetical protein
VAEVVALEVEPMEAREVYVMVENATGMYNGRLARVFRRAVRKSLAECRAAGGSMQLSSGRSIPGAAMLLSAPTGHWGQSAAGTSCWCWARCT